MKGKQSRPYLGFLKEYAFRKKLLPSYILTIAIIVLTAGVSLVRPELQGKVMPKYFKTFWECIKGDTYGILWVSQNQY